MRNANIQNGRLAIIKMLSAGNQLLLLPAIVIITLFTTLPIYAQTGPPLRPGANPLAGIGDLPRVMPPSINIPRPFNEFDADKRRVEAQNRKFMEEAERYERNGYRSGEEMRRTIIEKELMEEEFYREYIAHYNRTAPYRQAFARLLQMEKEKLSLTKAVFLVENAYAGNKLSYNKFINDLKFRVKQVKQILRREQLDTTSNLALNYGIQKLFTQTNRYYNSKTKQAVSVPPFRYDFEDYQGDKDYTKMFASKMLTTGKGQCHSMPLVYLMIAEQLQAQAWLSLAPKHSFIQFPDAHGNLLNFETTNGNIVSTNWLLQSGFITATALKAKTYLDTLSQQQLYAQCLADLLNGYLHRFGYDEFAERVQQKILQVSPRNYTALVVDANMKTMMAMQQIKAAGIPSCKDLPQYPDEYNAWLAMHAAYARVDSTGYQDMPPEAYRQWLRSVEQEKQQQQHREIRAQLQIAIEKLKKIKVVITNKPKG